MNFEAASSSTTYEKTIPVPRRWLRRATDWIGYAGLGVLIILIVMALFPSVFAPYDPSERVGLPLQRPSQEFLLGTNDIGQDLFSELITGTRISLATGMVVALLAVGFGTAIGVLSGYSNGALRSALVRLMDLILVLPFLPLVILLSSYLGPSQKNVVFVLILFYWAVPARLIYSKVLSLQNELYVEAARAIGAAPLQIMVKHILPGLRSLIIVQMILVSSASILAEASISFLGLGDPSVKSWGTMLYFARASGAFLNDAWLWWVVPTGAMLTLTILSLVLVGFSLEQRFEPGLRHRKW
ncbi:MAG: ABC transporter permease [Anaerolineales bacterium]|jgi:peptide/nickel transport system permease protein